MQSMYYVGLDVHKKTIRYCVKDVSGRIHLEGTIPATRMDLDRWMKILPQPWMAAMEATVFTGWIYDHLKPHAAVLKVAHPLMLRAIAAAKKEERSYQKGHQLLWTLRRREKFWGDHATHAAVQATQPAFADHSDRGGQNGAAKQPGLGHDL